MADTDLGAAHEMEHAESAESAASATNAVHGAYGAYGGVRGSLRAYRMIAAMWIRSTMA